MYRGVMPRRSAFAAGADREILPALGEALRRLAPGLEQKRYIGAQPRLGGEAEHSAERERIGLAQGYIFSRGKDALRHPHGGGAAERAYAVCKDGKAGVCLFA